MDRFGQGRRLVRRAMNPNAPMRQTAVRTENLIRVDEVRESHREQLFRSIATSAAQ